MADDTYCLDISIECISQKCPNFITLDEEKQELEINGRLTRNNESEGIYVYLVTWNDTNGEVKKQVEIIRQEPNKEKPANHINIDEPWEQWIITNEHNLPYPIGKQSESTIAEIFNSAEIRQQLLGKEASSKNEEGVVTKWSDE